MSNAHDATLDSGLGEPTDKTRRNLLVATCAAGGAATAAAVWPFVASLAPSERTKAAGAPVEVDISKLEPGQLQVVEWRGKPVWILRRTQEMLASLKQAEPKLADPQSEKPNQPEYAKNESRSIKDEYLVVVGICTHLGCSPTKLSEAQEGAGFLCPCHGSRFDYAGRVFANMPAPDNLIVPPHQYLSDTRLLIGEDTKGA
ncbi:MAG: ubiquinol-cytochrome c reductase iron-sulfur subunit [Pseudomonadota bacterium]|nr:MAG: ubiquinol-cytochrome c reductase iron-sulfur subunit [Pseudomonadota bacterium]